MPTVLSYQGMAPRLGERVYLADTAVVIGDVEIADQASIWFGAVLRGDVGPIRIGRRSNIQDQCAVHTTGGVSRAIVGEDVTVGHGCILHGCQVGDRVLVGMGSILLDNVVVGEDSVIGAGTLLTARTVIPPRSLVMGRPGRVVRQVTEEELRMGIRGATTYVSLAEKYLNERG